MEYLRQLDKKQRSVLIDLMEDGVKKEIAFSSAFDEDEIGSKMTTNYIAIGAGLNVRQAMKELVDQAADNDNISTIYGKNGLPLCPFRITAAGKVCGEAGKSDDTGHAKIQQIMTV